MVRYTIVMHAEYNLGLGIGQDFLEGPAYRFLALI
jgi:hypothetical protein